MTNSESLHKILNVRCSHHTMHAWSKETHSDRTLSSEHSSNPFSKRFPTWSVSHQSSGSPVVGPSPGFRIHFLLKTLLNSALRSASGSLARVLLASVLLRFSENFQLLSAGSGQPRDVVGVPLNLFPRQLAMPSLAAAANEAVDASALAFLGGRGVEGAGVGPG